MHAVAPPTAGRMRDNGCAMTRAEAIEEATRRLVRFYEPDQVYLMGSSARGDGGPESDLDFLVVLPDDAPRQKLIGAGIHRELWGIPFAVDVMPFRRSAFEARSGWLMSLPAIALREGRLLYERTAATV